jgi:hypothetical protein
MITSASKSQIEFNREFIMGRGKFNPLDFGVNMERDALMDVMVEDFHAAYRDGWSIDELLLHPREAAHFCDTVRRQHGYFDLPDDIILRSILTRRKNP